MHGIYLKNKLVVAKLLVNDKTIYQNKSVTNIKYYHVELDEHSILIANGVKSESYLNSGNKYVFDNATEADKIKVKHWRNKLLTKYITTRERAEPYVQKINKRGRILNKVN